MIRKIAQILVIIFFFSIPCENILTIGSIGSLSRFIGLGAAAVWFVSVLIEKRIRKFTLFYLMVFLFFIFNLMSIFWAVDYDLTLIRAKTFLQLAIQIWMIWDLITTEKIFRFSLFAFIVGTYFVIIDSINNFIKGQIISEWDIGRFSGGGQNAVELALLLSLCFPIAWYLAITEKSTSYHKIIKVICFSFVPAALFSIILTASRTAILSVIPGFFFILSTLKNIKPGYRFAIFSLALVIIIVGQSIIPQETLQRLSTFGTSISTGDLGGRSSLWKRGIQIFIEHPLGGIGSNGTSSTEQLGAVVHNTFISILAELGVIGFIIFLVLIISLFLQIKKMPTLPASLWMIVIIAWLIGVQSLTWEYTKSTWYFFSMAIIAANLIETNEKSKESQVFRNSLLVRQLSPIQQQNSNRQDY